MKPAMREIARAAADHFEITMDEVRFGSRKQKYAWPRQIAMALSRSMSDCSLPKIAEYFGGKDHTTAMHAVAAVEESARQDDQTLRDLVAIAAAASGMSIDRQRQEREWAQDIRCGHLSLVRAAEAAHRELDRKVLVPERSKVRGRRVPITLPSEFAPPSKARLMGARA
jgi:hypothetical protein